MKHDTDAAITLTNISKKYEIHHEKPTLVEKFVKGSNETFWALQDINLTIKKGERIGIIGSNGSGKTTLLKIIAGITAPSSGSVAIQGKVVSLIDLEAGFHPDLTGVQNIFLNGMLLGMNKQQVTNLVPDIIRFADIKQFIDAPLFTYSQGMKLRLGFSVAIYTNPDILLLDENIAVGDENFQKKSAKKLESFRKQNKTILIASHWKKLLKDTCDRTITIEQGRLIHTT